MQSSTAGQQGRARVRELADRLYRERYHHLLRIADRSAISRSDAEEAVQFGFMAFIEHFDPEGEAPALPWVTLTVKRRCWALYRARHLDRSVGQETEAEAAGVGPGAVVDAIPSRATGTEQLVTGVEEARWRLAALKPAERRVLGLIAAGCSYAEIGEITGFSYRKTNRCAGEGRAALRALTSR